MSKPTMWHAIACLVAVSALFAPPARAQKVPLHAVSEVLIDIPLKDSNGPRASCCPYVRAGRGRRQTSVS